MSTGHLGGSSSPAPSDCYLILYLLFSPTFTLHVLFVLLTSGSSFDLSLDLENEMHIPDGCLHLDVTHDPLPQCYLVSILGTVGDVTLIQLLRTKNQVSSSTGLPLIHVGLFGKPERADLPSCMHTTYVINKVQVGFQSSLPPSVLGIMGIMVSPHL